MYAPAPGSSLAVNKEHSVCQVIAGAEDPVHKNDYYKVQVAYGRAVIACEAIVTPLRESA